MKIKQNNVDRGYNAEFKKADFKEPGRGYWPTYSWSWADNVNKDEIAKQIDEFCESEIKSVYVLPQPREFRPNNGTQLDGYMQEEYLDYYRCMCEYALKKGMNIWLYDEGGWPSGSANGEVVLKDRNLAKRYYMKRDTALAAGESYSKPEDVVVAFDQNNNKIADGYTAKTDETVKEYYLCDKCYYNMPYPNLIDPKSARDFVEYTHERYRKKLGDLFSDNFKIVFTDEPAIAMSIWRADLEDIFTERYGYSYIDYMPAIVDKADMGEQGTKARIDYCELISEMFAENYFRVLQDWCRKNDMLSGGHIGGEDETLGCVRHGFVHGLRVLRCLDIPGIDAIWRQIFPKPRDDTSGPRTECANLFFPRYASSAAYQTSCNSIMSETNSIYGSGITFDQMRWVMNFQGIRGINLFNMMNQSYQNYGHFMAGGRPVFAPYMPGATDKSVFHRERARFSYLLAAGRPERKTALYMPMHDFWAYEDADYLAGEFERVGLTIESWQESFDVFDDDVIESCDDAALDNGVIKIGLAEYDELWFSTCKRVPAETKARLERFVKGGGKIFVVKGKYDPQIPGAKVIEDIGANVTPIVRCKERNSGIRAMVRNTENGTLLFILNENLEATKVTVSYDDIRPAYELNCDNGEVYTAGKVEGGSTTFELEMFSGECVVYLFTDNEVECDQRPRKYTEKIGEINNFTFKKISSFIIGKERLMNVPADEAAMEVESGDWQSFAGKDFSGDATYTAEFAKPADTDDILIDLGTVNYTCELFINGKSQGVRCMAPYSYIVPTAELKDTNTLELRVANTPANQYTYSENFNQFTKEILGPYHPICLRFEKESLESGLMNPITLWK